MPTIYDVARRAGVSTYTVSAVLNRSARVSPELTRRVLAAVEELDYTINDLARSLQTRRTRTVGMLIPDIGNPFYAQVVRGAEDALRKAGYSLLLGNSYDDAELQRQYLMLFRSKQVDGVLLFVAPGDGSEITRQLKGKPIVFVGRPPANGEADCVTADNKLGARLATAHLISRGHRRVGLITGHLCLISNADRVKGWKLALRRAGLKSDKTWIGEGDGTSASGQREMERLLELPEPPTAAFIANFPMTTGALQALRQRGLRSPEHVEIVCLDDYDWLDLFEPKLTTVVQPSYEMGLRAAELFLQRIENPRRDPQTIILEPKLRVRL